MSPAERASFEAGLDADPQWCDADGIPEVIRESIQRGFTVPPLDASILSQVFALTQAETTGLNDVTDPRQPNKPAIGRGWPMHGSRALRVYAVAAAACLIWSVVIWQWRGTLPVVPFFAPQSLVALHVRTVSEGFTPYYICDNPIRFAQTFAARQGVPLKLADLPEGARMLGLSYLGGLSRDTTAMLGEASAQPVMVFVDRLRTDRRQGTPRPSRGLRVFRRQLESLVLYEVTPLDHPTFLDAFQVTDAVPCEPVR